MVRSFDENDWLMELVIVNIVEVLRNLPVFNYAVKYVAMNKSFAISVHHRHGF